MTQTQFAESLLDSEYARHLLIALAERSIREDLPSVKPETAPPEIAWAPAITLASALCGAPHEQAQEACLRITQGCLADSTADAAEHAAAAVILERMGNRPAIQLAVRRAMVEDHAWTEAPVPARLDVIRRKLELTIPLRRGGRIEANPFQRQFWTEATDHRWVSVSASTSAGKSFIVKQWFAERAALADTFRGAYIVPTRALIDEVATDIESAFGDDLAVFTIPWDAEIGSSPRELFVMTQERVNLLLGDDPSRGFDVVFVDEAQKFDDDERGVLLQRVLDEISRRQPHGQVLFASPLTANPGLLLEPAPSNTVPVAIKATTVTVNQNLLWAEQVYRKPRDWNLAIMRDDEARPVGQFRIPARPQPESKRLPLVAVALGNDAPGTVVYVNGPSAAEKAALQIHDALGPDADLTADPDVSALSDLIVKTIHPQYALAQTVTRGVAFHYGSMPQLVRHEVERLFKAEKLRYLVCTSTLLEGVNLPCRLLVARGPKKGNGNPMAPGDFWNLAGRAGRWGKEFQGNIVCVDTSRRDLWPDPPRRRELQTLARATDRELEDIDRVIEYIRDGAPADRARADGTLEAVFSFLATRWMNRGTLIGIPALAGDDVARLEEAVEQAVAPLTVPPEIVSRHAGIGPLAMQRLLDHFASTPSWSSLLLPTAEADDAAAAYADTLEICHRLLGADFAHEKRRFALAILIIDWMRGRPLAYLISRRLTWLTDHGRAVKLDSEIRDVMTDVERQARFAAPKYLGCYLDILRWHLELIGESEAGEDLPNLSMMLELGVSRTTELSLVTLGLSRTSAIALSEFIIDDELDREQCLQWLRTHDLDVYPLPELVREEVRRRLARAAA